MGEYAILPLSIRPYLLYLNFKKIGMINSYQNYQLYHPVPESGIDRPGVLGR